MDFLGMGPLEILLILVVALIVFGPNKLPGIARNLGKSVNAFKKAASDITSEITREVEEEEKAVAEITTEINKELAREEKAVAEIADEVTQGLRGGEAQIESSTVKSGNQKKVELAGWQRPQADESTHGHDE